MKKKESEDKSEEEGNLLRKSKKAFSTVTAFSSTANPLNASIVDCSAFSASY